MDAPATDAQAHRPPADDNAAWRLVLLGRVEAQSATARITHWPTRAVASLLARLALAPHRAHAREELTALVWPDAPPDKGRARLRQALSNLRSLLRPGADSAHEPLLTDRHFVRLNPAAVTCDVLRFRHLLQLGRHDEARALYVGELMPGHYDEWVLEERARLQAEVDGLPLTHTPACDQPLDRVDAAADPARVRLPSYWTRAFGQDEALQRVTQQVQTHRLVTIMGPGGHGKTRLAVATALAISGARAAPFEWLVFVPLADATDADAVWAALVNALRIPGAGDPARRVAAHLAATAALLIMDNAEQLTAPAAQVLGLLLAACPALHLLVTSRRRLGLDGECVFELQGLALPADGGGGSTGLMDSAVHSAAVALFVDRARQSRADFHLTPHNAEHVVDLVTLLGGMPLAIELAASRLRALQPRALLQRLREDTGSPMLDLLARPGGPHGAVGRHASMREVVAWSWRQLPAPVAALVQAMSVFSAPATAAAAAQALAGLTRGQVLQASQLLACMAEAIDASLVQTVHPSPTVQTAEADTLYTLAPPVREYASEQCAPDDHARMRSRLRCWLTSLAQTRLPKDRAEVQPELAHAWPLLLRANADRAPAQALALVLALQSEFGWWPAMPTVVATLSWSVSQPAGDASDPLVSRGHYVLAALHRMRAQGDLAWRHAQLAYRTAPDAHRQAMALSIQSWIRLERGECTADIASDLRRALQAVRDAGDLRGTALVLSVQAQAAQDCAEDLPQAVALLEESVRLFERLGDQAQAGIRQVQLAGCRAQSGEPDRALAVLQHLALRTQAAAESQLRIYVLTALGRVQLQLGHDLEAHAALEEAADLARVHDWRGSFLPALLPLPRVWLNGGASAAAARLQGYLLKHWPETIGAFKSAHARDNLKVQALLQQRLGTSACAGLMQQGGDMTEEEVMRCVKQHRPEPQARPFTSPPTQGSI